MVLIKKIIIDRVINEAKYILFTKNTIREAAKYFKVSKSTVHKDLNERLIDINKDLYIKIKEIMKEHLETRHIKGGEATKFRYKVIEK